MKQKLFIGELVSHFLCQNCFSYAAKELSFINTHIKSQEQFDQFRAKFSELDENDFLRATFVTTQEDNVFAKSGFMPYKTVCAYIWIRK